MKQLLFLLLLATIPNLLTAQYNSPAQKKAIRYNLKAEYKKLSEEDGSYLLFNIGVRRYEVEGYSDFVNEDLSGFYGVNYGIKRSNFSYEIGINYIYHDDSHRIDVPGSENGLFVGGQVNNVIIPITTRYSIPLDANQKLRVGANFTANWIVGALNSYNSDGSGILYGDNSETEVIRYSWESKLKSSFFFKVGLHAKMKFLNSSFLIIQASQAFTFGPNRMFYYEWNSKCNEGNFQVDSKIVGLTGEIAYLIPLKVMKEKFKNLREN